MQDLELSFQEVDWLVEVLAQREIDEAVTFVQEGSPETFELGVQALNSADLFEILTLALGVEGFDLWHYGIQGSYNRRYSV